MSSDGLKLAACAGDAQIYTSTIATAVTEPPTATIPTAKGTLKVKKGSTNKYVLKLGAK